MKAVVYREYGPPEVLKIEEVEKPAPNENQALVKVMATSINAGDYRLMRADPALIRLMMGGIFKPKNIRMGTDIAGVVEAVGENVKQFKRGDEVFGGRSGAFAEYVTAREGLLAKKPANLTFEQAAAVPVAALTALQGLRMAGGSEARSWQGKKALIQGASGGVGTFAVQLAKIFGAEVTGVCSTRNVEMVQKLGADHVIDYTKEDFTKNGQKYDVIFAVNGYHSLGEYKRALSAQGIYLCAGGTMSQLFQAMLLGPLTSRGGKKLGTMGIAKIDQEDLVYLGELLEAGSITPVIDRSYTLEDIVEAMHYVEDKHAQGKVVIKVA